MRVWKCKQVVDFDQSTTTVKEEGNKTLQQKMTDKYNRFHIVTLAPNRILLKWWPSTKKKQKNKQTESSTAEVNWT